MNALDQVRGQHVEDAHAAIEAIVRKYPAAFLGALGRSVEPGAPSTPAGPTTQFSAATPSVANPVSPGPVSTLGLGFPTGPSSDLPRIPHFPPSA